MMFPCHHSPYEAGVLTRCLINKIHPCFAEKGGYTKNLYHTASPSLAGQSAVKTGSSPDFASSRLRSSQFLSDIIGFTQHYSGGTVPVSHRSSLLSFFKHLFTLFSFIYHSIPYDFCQSLYSVFPCSALRIWHRLSQKVISKVPASSSSLISIGE